MAAPTYGTDLTTIDLAESTTGWSALGGGASGLSASPDIAVEGTNCVDKQITNAEKGQVFDNGSGITFGTNDHAYIWISCTTPGLINTYTNRGLAAVTGSSTGNYVQYHLTGSDEFELSQAFKCWPIRPVNTSSGSRPRRTLNGTPTATRQVFGATMYTTASVKGANLGVDGMRKGTGFYVTAGDGTTPATFPGAAAVDLTNRYGILQTVAGGFALQGRFVVGQNTSGTPTAAYFSDTGRAVAVTNTEHALSDFTQIIVDHASSTFLLSDSSMTALGTINRGRFVVTSANPTVTLTRVSFTGIGVSNFYSNSTLVDCSFRGCGTITASGAADFSGTSVSEYDGTTNTSALVWNLATDPDTYMDGMSFTRLTSSLTHAIEFGTSTPTTITLRNMDFSGYSGTSNIAALDFKRTSGATTVNLVGCTGTITAQVTGTHGVTFVVDPVTTSVTVKDVDTDSPVASCPVYVQAADGTGPLPYNTAVTIARSGSVATVTQTAHGLSTGQKVLVRGTGDETYFGVKTITVTGTNTYTYAVTGTPANPTSCTVYGVVIAGVTDGSGVISDTRSWTAAQPVTGRARKMSASPYYRQGNLSGTVSATAGAQFTVLLVSDE